MPTDAENAALIHTAGSIANTAANAFAQSNINRQTRKYNDEWAYRQREWALQDWNMQNEYNSPAEQRKRMIEAGMNPALMYGAGAGGGNSTPVRAGSAPNWNPTPPRIDLGAGGGIMTYLAVQRQTAEIDQMTLQNDLLREKITGQSLTNQLTIDKSKLTVAQAAKVQSWIDANKEITDAGLGMNAYGTQLSSVATDMYLKQQQSSAQTNLIANENVRRDIYTSKNAEQIAARISLMAAQEAKTDAERKNIEENYKLLVQSGVLKQIDIDGARFLTKTLGGPAGQLLLGILRKAGIAK